MDQKKFIELLKKKDKNLIRHLLEEKKWPSLAYAEDRELLAGIFKELARKQLRERDLTFFETMELAGKAAPDSFRNYLEISEIFAEFHLSPKCQSLSAKALEKSLELNPIQPMIWCKWGEALLNLGQLTAEESYYYTAQEKILKALSFKRELCAEKRAYILWQLGRCYFLQGTVSGEALDLKKAIELYNTVSNVFHDNGKFWNDLGEALFDLTLLIGSDLGFFEVALIFVKAVSYSPDLFDASYNLAHCYHKLYESNHLEEYLTLALERYERASELDPESLRLWKSWGSLLLHSGSYRSDIKHLEECNEKFQKADEIDHYNVEILSKWAEAQMLAGAMLDQHELLRESETKIIQCLELDSDNADLWALYGSCLYELGRYFADEGLYMQALEKLHYGITVDRLNSRLWYGLALTCSALGEIKGDASWFEKSSNYFTRVLEFGGQITPQFWNDWGYALFKHAECEEDPDKAEQAIEKFERAIGQQEDSFDNLLVNIDWLYNYGCALEFLGRVLQDSTLYEKAVQVYSQVLDSDPEYGDAQFQLASGLLGLGELVGDYEVLQKAGACFEHLLTEDNEDEQAWNDWGLVLLNLAELTADPSHLEVSMRYFREAEEKFHHAIALGNTGSYYNLACLNSMIGNYNASLYYIERAEHYGVLPLIEELMNDDWLEGVRQTEGFKNFLSQLSRNYQDGDMPY